MTFAIEQDLHSASKKVVARLIKRIAKKKLTPTSNEPQIPSPALFEPLFPRQMPEVGANALLPSIAECAVHLEFLECLYNLRQRVLQSTALDTIFSIKEVHRTVRRNGKSVQLKDPTLQDKRQAKWKSFVEWSVARFLVWTRNLQLWCPRNGDDADQGLFRFTADTVPPLDVLMVLHTLLLNTALFRRECGNGPLRDLRFPWPILHSVIDNATWDLKLGAEATAHFATWLGMKTDLLEEMLSWHWDNDNHMTKPLVEFKHEAKTNYPSYPVDWEPPVGRPGLFNSAERPLGALLAAAVMRQCSFIDKMHDQLWIRSPAVEGTLTRAIARYEQFLTLMKLNPDQMLVPTLDIDLAWHTHQCSPRLYAEGTMQLAGRFINHDDTVAEAKLDTGFDKTRELYLMRFGKEYRVCGCWDCEALVSALRTSGAHETPNDETLQKVSEEVSYYKTVESARQQNLPLPDRSQWANAHGSKK